MISQTQSVNHNNSDCTYCKFGLVYSECFLNLTI